MPWSNTEKEKEGALWFPMEKKFWYLLQKRELCFRTLSNEKVIEMRSKVFLLISLLSLFHVYSQEENTLLLDYSHNFVKWRFYGINFEQVNENFGLSLSNGLKEQPLIHFEDLQENILYDVSFQTNFTTNYTYGLGLGWDYPFIPFSLIDIHYVQRSFVPQNYFQRDFHIGGLFSSGIIGIPGSLITRLGYQTLNDRSNLGVSFGWQKTFRLNKKSPHSNFYVGVVYTNYNDYERYNAFIRGFLFNEKMSYSFSYERIDQYDFLNFSINFVLLKPFQDENHPTR